MMGIIKSWGVLLCLVFLWTGACASGGDDEIEEPIENVDQEDPIESPVPGDDSGSDSGDQTPEEEPVPEEEPEPEPEPEMPDPNGAGGGTSTGGGGLFCQDDSECENTHCCLELVCVRGDVIFGACIPN